MTRRTRCRRPGVEPIIVAACFGAAAFSGLWVLDVRPAWHLALAALVVATVSLTSPWLAAVVAVILLCIPLAIASPALGIVALVFGLLAAGRLGREGGGGFIAASASSAATIGPAWAGPVLSGFVLGPFNGAVAAGIACLAVESYGIVTGAEAIGPVLIGVAGEPLLQLSESTPFSSFGWTSELANGFTVEMFDPLLTLGVTLGASWPLLVQPLLWAGSAALCGVLVERARLEADAVRSAAGVAVSVLALAASSATVSVLAGADTAIGSFVTVFAMSLVAGVAGVAVDLALFTRPVRRRTTAEDDAEVDELLRLIADAEETLADRHTVQTFVLMSDLKGFTAMTEEEGAVASAKAVQRHRDLLLPIIERHSGQGKPTGGDGLVAAFPEADNALAAAVEMQRSLDAHNREHQGDRALTVRIGVADGEVVVDRSGRPFIGSALNLAARVMSLADGGQAFATGSVAARAGSKVRARALGAFELKNIANPVEVVEVHW